MKKSGFLLHQSHFTQMKTRQLYLPDSQYTADPLPLTRWGRRGHRFYAGGPLFEDKKKLIRRVTLSVVRCADRLYCQSPASNYGRGTATNRTTWTQENCLPLGR